MIWGVELMIWGVELMILGVDLLILGVESLILLVTKLYLVTQVSSKLCFSCDLVLCCIISQSIAFKTKPVGLSGQGRSNHSQSAQSLFR